LEQGILKLSLDKGNKLKEGHGGLPRKWVLCVCVKEIKRRMKCDEGFLVLMCGEVFMEKGVCKNQAWKKVVCSKYS
jgi:hypothetical protein